MLDVFAADARKYMDRLRLGMEAEPERNLDVIRRSARRLHHSAVLANHEAVIHASAALQKTAVQLIAGKQKWSSELQQSLQATVNALDAVVSLLPHSNEAAETQLREAADELSGAPIEIDDSDVAGQEPEWEEPEVTEDHGAEVAEAVLKADDSDALLNSLIQDLGDAVERLESDPRDREPLKLMLRKIRRLRELGRIEVLSPQDKALGAVEEMILQIADLNATVGPGYLTVFAHARDVLEEMRGGGEHVPSVTRVGGRAIEVDRLKDQVMEKVRRSRQVVWVSDLFYGHGPHIVTCPVAEAQGGEENYFLAEARQRMERSENLRLTMLEANTEQMRLAGESLSHTLRHLRERAAAFNHSDFGRVTRRAAAALRVQLVRPPKRLKEMAAGLEDVFTALQAYLDADDDAARAGAVSDADAALHMAVLGGEPAQEAGEVAFDPDAALKKALTLRARIDDRLRRLSGEDTDRLREDLEEMFDLISRYVSESADRH
jgi:hypothetical protein